MEFMEIIALSNKFKLEERKLIDGLTNLKTERTNKSTYKLR